jgi:hypothetical protein
MTEVLEVKSLTTSRPKAMRSLEPQDFMNFNSDLTSVITNNLKAGTNKPSLMKAGAERILKSFGCTARYELIVSEVDHFKEVKWEKRDKSGTSIGLYRYTIKCEIVSQNGSVVGDCLGSCSTLESKYIDRPRDMENVVLKMAQKRALVGATLNAFSISDRFTQDVEDLDIKAKEKEPPPAYIYSGSEADEIALFALLEKEGVPKEKHREISIRLIDKPKNMVREIIKEIMQ